MIQLYNITQNIISYFTNLGNLLFDFLFRDFLGFPLLYWLFGGGLFVYLTAKIVLSLVF